MTKKTVPFKNLLILIVGLVLSFPTFSQPNWSYTVTAENHTLFIPFGTAYINTDTLQQGDYVGVFFLDGTNYVCGGYREWEFSSGGSGVAITAWGDDSGSSQKDGFAPGETFTWKIWQGSSNTEFDAFATYNTAMPHTDSYFTNGISALASLMTSNDIIPSVTAVSCFGLSDGAIDISVNFGTSPYTYAWSNGASTEDLTNLQGGSYSITVTDALAVSHNLSMLVNEPLELVANILISEANAFMCLAHAQAYPFGGTAPYSYQWNDPNMQTTSLADDLCPGTYSVTVTDANTCTTDTTIQINANSSNVTDSAFTLIDTCILNNLPDTAYISNLYYTANTMEIEWTIVEGSITHVINTTYGNINTAGIYYVGLVINCGNKNVAEISLVSIIEIDPSVFVIDAVASGDFTCLIHPNPINEKLSFKVNNLMGSTIKVEVFNSIGSMVHQSEVEVDPGQLTSIAMPELTPGVYFAKMYNQFNQSSILKFIK